MKKYSGVLLSGAVILGGVTSATFDFSTLPGADKIKAGSVIQANDILALSTALGSLDQRTANFEGNFSINGDGVANFTNGLTIPTYATEADLPANLAEGTLVFVSGKGLFVSDGSAWSSAGGSGGGSTDYDNDGLPDTWESLYGGNLDPAGNNDTDSLTNLQEYTAGTNPTLGDTDGGGTNDDVEINDDNTDPLVAGDDISHGPDISCTSAGLVKDAKFGDGEHDFCYSTIVAADGTTWLNNTLGAEYNNVHSANFNPTQQAQNEDDYLAYGSLFQWGRPADGHELRTCTSGTECTAKYGDTATLSADLTPSNNTFIKNSTSPYDWTTTDSDGSQRTAFLAKSDGTGICPAGFRLPTETELEATRVAENITNEASYLASAFKGVLSGYRNSANASFSNLGAYEDLWSSTADGTNSRFLYVRSSDQGLGMNNRARGYTARCLSED